MIRKGLRGALILALLLASCGPRPIPASPALWLVEDAQGHKAWLFGTIHGFDRPVAWRTPAVERALGEADMVIVEIADLADRAAVARIFAGLAASRGQPPLSQRVPPELRGKLNELLKEQGLADDSFAQVETWAAALTLARGAAPDKKSEFGIDLSVLEAAGSRPVVELEGAAGQLELFDRLPEAEQRDLLAAVVVDASLLGSESADLAQAWRRGDMKVIASETRRGLLADPELREALLTGRNRRWTERIRREMKTGRKPFIAVGAAHMAGPEGLPALLSASGLAVSRLR